MFNHVEMTIFSWIITNTGNIDPITVIRAHIMVNLEPKKIDDKNKKLKIFLLELIQTIQRHI